jgi:hypothetical protein
MGDAMDISSDDELPNGDRALTIQMAGLFAMLEMELMEEGSHLNKAYKEGQFP